MTQTSQNSATSNTTGKPRTSKNSPVSTDHLRPTAHVCLETVRNNYLALSAHAHGAEAAAVVKANGYGHGAIEVASALRDIGCRTFFVAYLNEGIALRDAIGSGPVIYVFNGIQKNEQTEFVSALLTPVCNSVGELSVALECELSSGFALHFDTGMNRLGLRMDDLPAILDRLSGAEPRLVMSHLACADQPDHPRNAEQLERFQTIRAAFPNVPASLSATAGIYLGPDYAFDLVRPGIGLYGGGPARPPGLKLRTAMTLTAPILNVFEVAAGDPIGYGASYAPKQNAVIATVALGYADGYLRSGGNYGFAVIDSIPCPVVGRISMDLITLDVTDLPDRPKVGDRAEFIGKFAGYEIQAEALGTLGYELTSRIGDRVLRSWS